MAAVVVVVPAAAAALTEVARDARRYIRDEIQADIDDPSPWTLSAVEFVIVDPAWSRRQG